MKTSVATIDEAISNSSGEAVSALNEKVEDFSSEMSSCGTELQDLETVIDGFITKMTEFIKPVVEDKMMRVDSTDISCNMDSIISACEYVQNLPSKVGTWVAKSEFASMASEEKIRAEENNDAKLAEIRWLIYNTYSPLLDDEISELEKKFDIIEAYEACDDEYKAIMDDFKDKYTDFLEGVFDVLEGIWEAISGFVEGLIKGIYEMLVGIIEFAWGAIKFLGAAIVVGISEAYGIEPPKWADDCYNNTKDMIKLICNDPMLIVEGFAQGISDGFEEEGLAYSLGYGLGSMADVFIGSKGLGSLSSKLGKGGKVVSHLDEFGDISTTAKTIENLGDITTAANKMEDAGDVATTINKLDETGDVSNIAEKMDDIPETNADDLAELYDDGDFYENMYDAQREGCPEYENYLDELAESQKEVPDVDGDSKSAKTGEFFIDDWNGYPDAPKPDGPFRILEGTEYTNARNLANKTNANIHRNRPDLKGTQIHEMHPVKFGGSPTDIDNKIALSPKEHAKYTAFWNKVLREQKGK